MSGIAVLHGIDMAGPTVGRPTNAYIGASYYDTDTDQHLIWTGDQWLVAASGAGAEIEADGVEILPGQSVQQTVLSLDGVEVDVTDSNAYGSTQLLTFPEGRILVLGVTASIQWAVLTPRASTINDSASLTWALGGAAASSDTLASGMVDLLPKTTKVLAAAAAALNTPSNAALAASAQFDGTSSAREMHLNCGFETGTDIDGDGTLAATGTINTTWINLGDY